MQKYVPIKSIRVDHIYVWPLSNATYNDPTALRYVYKAVTEEDRWIVPFHAPTLLAWDTHCNFQYVTSKGFARYMTKYISKAEPHKCGRHVWI